MKTNGFQDISMCFIGNHQISLGKTRTTTRCHREKSWDPVDFPFHQSFWSEDIRSTQRLQQNRTLHEATLRNGCGAENSAERLGNGGNIWYICRKYRKYWKISDHPGLIPPKLGEQAGIDQVLHPGAGTYQSPAISSLGLELRPVVAGIQQFLGFFWRQGRESSELGFSRGVYCLVMVMDADFWWFQVSQVLYVLSWPTRKCSRHCFRFARGELLRGRVAQVGSSSLFEGMNRRTVEVKILFGPVEELRTFRTPPAKHCSVSLHKLIHTNSI